MLKRIRHAAAQVCGGEPDLRELRERRYFKHCVRATTKDAVRQVDAPLLSALLREGEAIEYGTASR
jgi:UrcA family protein